MWQDPITFRQICHSRDHSTQGIKIRLRKNSHARTTRDLIQQYQLVGHPHKATKKDMTRDNYRDIEVAQLRRLKFGSFVEGTTLVLLLGIAVPLKHLCGWPTGVRVMGPVYGLVFCAYLWFVVQTVTGGDWRAHEVVRLLLSAFIPFGAFFNRALLSRKMVSIRTGEQ